MPNRGSLQNDIDIFGLTYLQQVNDAATDEGIHIEPGIWLHVPATSDPKKPATIVRQSTIPHGDSLLAGEKAPVKSALPTSRRPAPNPIGWMASRCHSAIPIPTRTASFLPAST